jgi:hypothetical protein
MLISLLKLVKNLVPLSLPPSSFKGRPCKMDGHYIGSPFLGNPLYNKKMKKKHKKCLAEMRFF